jgi:hypothetical protein
VTDAGTFRVAVREKELSIRYMCEKILLPVKVLIKKVFAMYPNFRIGPGFFVPRADFSFSRDTEMKCHLKEI